MTPRVARARHGPWRTRDDGAVTFGVSSVQLLRGRVRRTVEEARLETPPAMERVSQAHQWVAAAAAVAAHLPFRVF